MRMHLWPTVTLVTVAAALSCGGSSDDGGTSSIPIADLPKDLADAECKIFEQCEGALIKIFLNGEDCRTLFERRVQNSDFSQLEAGVKAGNVSYDGKAAAECLKEIDSRSCDALSNRTFDSCDRATEGTVAAGGDCTHDFECTGTAFCKYSGSCPGKCTDKQVAGASCTADDQCQDGLVCSEKTRACIKPAANGEACGLTAPPCTPSLMCAGETDNTGGTCRPWQEVFVGKTGAACALTSGLLCTTDLACVIDNLQQLTGTCQAIASSGGACKRAAIPSGCPSGEYCDGAQTSLDGTCKQLPAAGQPCATILGKPACAPYTRCVTGTCQALQDNGNACTIDGICYSGHCVTGVCRTSACAQ